MNSFNNKNHNNNINNTYNKTNSTQSGFDLIVINLVFILQLINKYLDKSIFDIHQEKIEIWTVQIFISMLINTNLD